MIGRGKQRGFWSEMGNLKGQLFIKKNAYDISRYLVFCFNVNHLLAFTENREGEFRNNLP